MSPSRSMVEGMRHVSNSPPDVSVIITAHREGLLAHRTLQSVRSATRHAEADGVACEILVILDRPDEETRSYFQREGAGLSIHEVDFGDPAPGRNFGIQCARGTLVTCMDADDLVDHRWLLMGCRTAQTNDARTAVVPELVIRFGADWFVFRQPNSDDAAVDLRGLIDANFWTMPCLMRRATALEIPYADTRGVRELGYEDWHWYATWLAAGGTVKAAPETCLFVRDKPRDSRSAAHRRMQAEIPPTPFFAPLEFSCRFRESAPKGVQRGPRSSGGGLVRLQAIGLEMARSGVRIILRHFPQLRPLVNELYLRSIRWTAWPWRNNGLPEWLESTWRKMHEIEPQLYPEAQPLTMLNRWHISMPVLGSVYGRMCSELTSAPTHLILVPWLTTGGSDLETLNYVRYLTEQQPQARVVVIATDRPRSPWAERLPAAVPFVNFAAFSETLLEEERLRLLGLLLIQWQPKVVHVMNSQLGFDAIEHYGPAITRTTRIFVSAFCEDVARNSRIVGHVTDRIPACLPHTAGIFADNRRILSLLRGWYAIPEDRLHCHYQPMMGTVERKPPRETRPALHVLWAARLDRQKRPDVLLRVVEAAAQLPIVFHIYGSQVLSDVRTPRRLFRQRNVRNCGPFARFQDLPLDTFDLFLNTSQWEGLPNVLLEAAAAGMPIVSSDAGGIPEFLTHEETGFLVSPFDHIAGYVEIFRRLIHHPEDRNRVAAAAAARLHERHSWPAFIKALEEIPEYGAVADSSVNVDAPGRALDLGESFVL